MDKPKELTGLDSDNYDYPLADVSHLSEKEKQDLLRRGMHIPKELHSDEEFEQWVTLFAEWNKYSKCYTLLVTLLIIRYILILRIINVPKMRQE